VAGTSGRSGAGTGAKATFETGRRRIRGGREGGLTDVDHELTDSMFDDFADSDDINLTGPPTDTGPAVSMEDLELADVEREICRLPDVSIARIVADRSGRVTEVHVVAQPGKRPKQIVRDVQSIALASFRLE